jgi:hypothetical protein
MTAANIDVNRPVNDVLAEAWDGLFAKLERLGAPAPLQAARIEFDPARGQAKFTWDHGDIRVAPAQFVGVAQPEPGGPPEARFMRWGWDEASVADGVREPALRLLALGREKGWEELTTPVVRLHVDRIWAYCGLAADLTGAHGAVMSRTQGREVFFTIGPLSTGG